MSVLCDAKIVLIIQSTDTSETTSYSSVSSAKSLIDFFKKDSTIKYSNKDVSFSVTAPV